MAFKWKFWQREPQDVDLTNYLTREEKDEYFGLALAGGLSTAGNLRMAEMEEIAQERYEAEESQRKSDRFDWFLSLLP